MGGVTSAAASDPYGLKHGFTVGDVHRMTRMAMTWARTRSLDSDDRHEAAYFAICEALYSAPAAPSERDLIAAGARAIDDETRAWLQQHGRRDDTQPNAAFGRFWINQPHGFPEDRICELLALPVVMERLTTREMEALNAAASFGDLGLAATALGIPYKVMTSRVAAARKRFMAVWFDHEHPPTKGGRGTCNQGHDRSIYGRLPPSGHWYCVKCRREYRIRRRAKGKT